MLKLLQSLLLHVKAATSVSEVKVINLNVVQTKVIVLGHIAHFMF